MLTNRLNLPDGVVAAVTNDPYTRGDSDISVTQLIAPPYQRKLRTEVEVIEDVSDRIWSLLGQCVHLVLERAYRGKGRAEERLFTECNGWRVSGQFDVIEDGCLMDYKVTSVWAVKGDTKVEWEQQLNLLRLLAHRSGIEVTSLRIIAILRDWSKGKSNAPGYPDAQVVSVDIPLWPLHKAEAYLMDRVMAHQDPAPPVCSDTERWKKEDIFAVMKKGRKSAIKLHDTRKDALAMVSQMTVDHYIERRPGGYTRCDSYCNVSHQCAAMKTEAGF